MIIDDKLDINIINKYNYLMSSHSFNEIFIKKLNYSSIKPIEIIICHLHHHIQLKIIENLKNISNDNIYIKFKITMFNEIFK